MIKGKIIKNGIEFHYREIGGVETTGWDSQYYMGFSIYKNKEHIVLDENKIFIEPFTDEELNINEDILYENGEYIIEVAKDLFDKDTYLSDKEYLGILEEYCNAFLDVI